MALDVSPYARSYNSFSGTDIKGIFGNHVVSELQAISYSVTREKGPIYTMGSPNPRAFSRGKRGIAGTVIMIMFDSPALTNLVKYTGVKFFADNDEIQPGGTKETGEKKATGDFDFSDLASTTVAKSPISSVLPAQGLQSWENDSNAKTVKEAVNVTSTTPWYTDQIPPIDVTLTAANEYGAIAVMKIWGVEFLNEGYGVSIDDIVSEEQMTWVGRDITKWVVVEYPQPDVLYGKK